LQRQVKPGATISELELFRRSERAAQPSRGERAR